MLDCEDPRVVVVLGPVGEAELHVIQTYRELAGRDNVKIGDDGRVVAELLWSQLLKAPSVNIRHTEKTTPGLF